MVELLRLHVDEPDPPEMLVGLHTTLSPVDGLVEVDMLTVPVKPFWGETVVVKESVEPVAKVRLEGLAVRL